GGLPPGATLGTGRGEGAPGRPPRTRGTPEERRGGTARWGSEGEAALLGAELPALRNRRPRAGPALVFLQHSAGPVRGLRGNRPRGRRRRERVHRSVPDLRGDAAPAHPPRGAPLRAPLRRGGAATGGARPGRGAGLVLLR